MSLTDPAALPPFPHQPEGVAWPTSDWVTGDPDPDLVDVDRLRRGVVEAVTQVHAGRIGETKALLCVHRGRLVAEAYAEDVGPEDTLPSWSMAKSVLGSSVGLLMRDGLLRLEDHIHRPEWPEDDPRTQITVRDLLTMRDGIRFTEEYVPDGTIDVVAMIYGEGRDDVAGYVANCPLEAEPGTRFAYSSGTSNLLAWMAGEAVGGGRDGWEAFIRRELLDPIGMRSPILKYDGTGHWIGSSFCFATARDFARFGLLHLRGGVWDGREIVPRSWVDASRLARSIDPDGGWGYGFQWWTRPELGGFFAARGYAGQYVFVAPALDLVLVRLGVTPEDLKPNAVAWLLDLGTCFRPVAGAG